MSAYFGKLSLEHPEVAVRYKGKLTKINGVDPYTFNNSELCFNTADFPSVTSMDIVSYLVLSTSFYTKEQMKAFKSLNAYKYFESGFVSTCAAKRINNITVITSNVSILIL